MADTKISAMTPATQVFNGDLVPIVDALTNFAATRQLLLTAGAGEDIIIQGVAGQSCHIDSFSSLANIAVEDAGVILASATTQLEVTTSSGGVVNLLTLTSAGGVVLSVDQTLIMTVGINGLGLLTFNGGANSFVVAGFATVSYQYPNLHPGNWSGSIPTTVQNAIDRCAALLRTLNGGVGP